LNQAKRSHRAEPAQRRPRRARFATLEEVIDQYDQGIQSSATPEPTRAKHLSHGGLGPSDEDKRALVAYLKALSDEPQVPASR
jgi:hypothetical protein